jgi:hypothetical protein
MHEYISHYKECPFDGYVSSYHDPKPRIIFMSNFTALEYVCFTDYRLLTYYNRQPLDVQSWHALETLPTNREAADLITQHYLQTKMLLLIRKGLGIFRMEGDSVYALENSLPDVDSLFYRLRRIVYDS